MHHIFLFDGTQNGLDDEHPTNIRLMIDLLDGHLDSDGHEQRVHYFEGPGNDERNILQHIMGSLMGTDMHDIVQKAVDTLLDFFEPGDKISSKGFSRGGANCRKFCSAIGKLGYATEFMGCFDTVFAMMPFGPLQQHTLFGDLHVSGMVKNARHVVSLDEDRQAFAPNLMNKRPGIKEVWFKGNHADIGGGYKDRGLADITIHWMLAEAGYSAGISHGLLDTKQKPNLPHHEKLPLLREKRVPVVLVDGERSKIEPCLYREE